MVLTRARAQAFLIDSTRFVKMRGWLAPLDFRADRAAGDTGHKARKACAEQALEDGQQARRRARNFDCGRASRVRKDLKKLRYAVEFFSSLFSAKRIDPFLSALKKLQTVFGDLNDAETLKAMFTETEIARVTDMSAQRAMGWMIGTSQMRAEFELG